MGELGALFNPGMRHELEERRAKAARREEEGNAKDGDLRIDLESGVAVINAPGQDDSTGSGTDVTDKPPATGSASADSEDGPQAPSGAMADSRPAETPGTEDPTTSGSPVPSAEPRKAGQPAQQLRPRGKRGVAAGR
jgi:hypothetical protein